MNSVLLLQTSQGIQRRREPTGAGCTREAGRKEEVRAVPERLTFLVPNISDGARRAPNINSDHFSFA